MSEESGAGGYVYLFEAVGTEWVKVGVAKNPFERLRVLQTGCPYTLRMLVCFWSPDPYRTEQDMHEVMADYRCPAGTEFFNRRHPAIQQILLVVSSPADPIPF